MSNKTRAGNLPTQPVLDILAQTGHTLAEALVARGVESAKANNAETVFNRSHTKGHMAFYAADNLAIALGYHPSEIWGEAWWDAAEDMPAYIQRQLDKEYGPYPTDTITIVPEGE